MVDDGDRMDDVILNNPYYRIEIPQGFRIQPKQSCELCHGRGRIQIDQDSKRGFMDDNPKKFVEEWEWCPNCTIRKEEN